MQLRSLSGPKALDTFLVVGFSGQLTEREMLGVGFARSSRFSYYSHPTMWLQK